MPISYLFRAKQKNKELLESRCQRFRSQVREECKSVCHGCKHVLKHAHDGERIDIETATPLHVVQHYVARIVDPLFELKRISEEVRKWNPNNRYLNESLMDFEGVG